MNMYMYMYMSVEPVSDMIMGDAAVMGEVNYVPLARCRGPWSVGWVRAGARARKGDFRF